jgi:hypothetical protein
MSDLEDLSIEPDYSVIVPGMEIITEDAMILGRIISVEFSSRRGSPNIFFVDTIYPILNLFSSVYQMSALEIVTIGHDRIILAKDALSRITEIKAGVFRSIGFADSLNTKTEKRKLSYQRVTVRSKGDLRRNTGGDDAWYFADRSDRHPDNEEPPYSRVTVPKKPNAFDSWAIHT